MLAFYLAALNTDEDRQTFENIYEGYRSAALRAALRVCDGNHAIAEDAVQNAFLKIIRDWDNFLRLSRDKWRSRIVIIAKNKAIDLLRQEKRLVSVYSEMGADESEVTDFGMDVLFEHEEDSQFIADCVAKLPEIYKTVLTLRFYDNLLNTEIAQVLGLTPHAVAMRISRGKQQMLKIIDKEGKEQ